MPNLAILCYFIAILLLFYAKFGCNFEERTKKKVIFVSLASKSQKCLFKLVEKGNKKARVVGNEIAAICIIYTGVVCICT